MRSALPLAASLLSFVLAGCAGGSDFSASHITGSFKDADQRYTNNVNGLEDTSKTINVPAGTSKLTVKALYTVNGIANFELKNPAGVSQKKDDVQGQKNADDPSWYEAPNPVVGGWTLKIHAEGQVVYAFWIYY